MQLRDYQISIVKKVYEMLKALGIVYLAMEVRTGKTLCALTLASAIRAKKVLFLTKKKAVKSIEEDYKAGGFAYSLTVTNFEQAGNLQPIYDLVIVYEAHSLGAYPKPSQRTTAIKKLVGDRPVILLSGTPTPESYSQLYHQFWISEKTPFALLNNFYKWSRFYVDKKEKMINGYKINDYSHAKKDEIMEVLKPYMLTFTQEEAGFNQEIFEEVKYLPMAPKIKYITEILLRDNIFQMDNGAEIICDTPAKKMSKLHQLYSGTVKDECGNSFILDKSKAEYIKNAYKGKKIAVYYKFVAEGDALKEIFAGQWTDSPEEFNSQEDKVFICQIQSGSMGVNLSTADYIVFYNIDFSALQYWQARARMQSKDRKKDSIVHWIFTEGGIEDKIYKTVIKKKSFTTYYF